MPSVFLFPLLLLQLKTSFLDGDGIAVGLLIGSKGYLIQNQVHILDVIAISKIGKGNACLVCTRWMDTRQHIFQRSDLFYPVKLKRKRLLKPFQLQYKKSL